MVERENKTQSDAIKLLKQEKCFVHKNPQNMYTRTGIPDLTVCVPVTLKKLKELYNDDDRIGLYVGIEMKRPKRLNGVSTAQMIVGKQIQQCGGIWFPADGTKQIEELLKRLGL